MNLQLPRPPLRYALATAFGLLGALNAAPASAAVAALADVPLANATTATILPNIFFVLDDSGSMGWDYMPDFVNDSFCRGTGSVLVQCQAGDPPFYANAFNRVYYNPLVNYSPPLNPDGTSKTSYTTWTDVPRDGYGIQTSARTNLVSSYPERVACKNSSDDVNSANCKSQIDASNAYTYPDGTYKNIKTRNGAPFYYTATVQWCKNKATSGPEFGKSGTCQTKKDNTYKYPLYSNWKRVDITPSTSSYTGPNATTRTYAQEMTNFANWYAWYRTRMQMMKTGVGQAFANIRGTPNSADATDKNYFHARVGFSTISYSGTTDGGRYQDIANFDTTQKNTWFSRLYAIDPSGGTPLLGALSKAGQIYAGKKGVDPVQYTCQRNFTILSTDGYWNSVTSSYGPDKEDGSTDVGDQDGGAGVSRPAFDSSAAANTLADVAYYYYNTDLRPAMTNNVPPAGTKTNEDDVAQHQHMTTFTIGLGVDGTLTYQDGYRSSTSGDYFDIKQGTKNWPNPTLAENETRIDDLWHAAINGRGTYFSARDPESLTNGLTTALGAMSSTTGAGAAAATSNLEPTAGDNFIYIASYRTVSWDGELSAYTLDLNTGTISSTSSWKVSGQLDARIGATGDTDTRTIYTSTGSTLRPFTWANLTATEKAWLDNTKLSQYSDWSAADKSAATGELLLNFLRGQNRYEDQARDTSFGSYNRLYRDRSTTLGDIVHAQPVYVKAPVYNYLDTGYSTFKASQSTRPGTVYVASNDGMLHAFNAETGAERWAYVPPMVTQELWRLADRDYATNHRFFVDGTLAVSDIFDGGAWKTILVGGLGKGGRGYYALDITDPTTPKMLWTYSANDNPNIGYSFGVPMVTKVNGQWVVLLTSGHNNIPEGADYGTADGQGYVFMLNAATGTIIKTISTGVGSIGAPSGLARLNIKVDDFDLDNSAVKAYGGDLLGNMWRFDLVAGTASKVIALGGTQAITASPEIGEIDGKTVLFFGTGRYLSQSDLADTQTQSFYAVKDDGTTIPKASLIAQVANTQGITSNAVDWNNNGGWYADLPITKERVHLEAQLFFGTLIFSSIIPDASECQPGGSSRLYFVDYRSGGTKLIITYTSPIVGFTVAKLPGGTPKVYPITADGGFPKGEPPTLPIDTSGVASSKTGTRLMWRELVD